VPPARPLLLAALLATLGGCGREERPQLPEACTGGAAAVRDALRAAPGEVRLDGIAISDCFVRESGAAEIAVVGQSVLEAAAPLAERSREDPESGAAAQLGYLVGAVRRGAAGTQGIHDELVRRLSQEIDGVDADAGAYRRGLAAGGRSG